MDKEEENKTTDTEPLYPEPTRGPLSDDHSNYAKPGKWSGGDPDKHMTTYFILFVIFMGFMFLVAVQSLSGKSIF